MAAVLVWEVFIRYAYRPTLWAVDMATIFYGTHFFIAGAMTLYLGKHIRTDFFYGNWSMKTQCWVDAICYLFLFLPGMVLFVWLSWDFFSESWDLKEELMTTWRPPAYPYKLVIPLSGFLIVLQGISELIKCIQTIRDGSGSPLQAGRPPRNYLNRTFPWCGMTSGIGSYGNECTILCGRNK